MNTEEIRASIEARIEQDRQEIASLTAAREALAGDRPRRGRPPKARADQSIQIAGADLAPAQTRRGGRR